MLQNATESSDGIIQAEIAIELSSEPQSRSNILETTTQSTTNLFVNLDDSATVNITIPLIDEHANADELEKKLREILNNVSDQLDLGDDEATTIATRLQDTQKDAKISENTRKYAKQIGTYKRVAVQDLSRLDRLAVYTGTQQPNKNPETKFEFTLSGCLTGSLI